MLNEMGMLNDYLQFLCVFILENGLI